MRHGRLTAIAAAALLAMAIAPAWAAADPSPLTDDTLTDFAAGTPGSDTWAIEPGIVALKPSFNDNFAGTSLDSSNWSTATGTPTVGLGALTLDGAEIDSTSTFSAPQTLQFRATFGGDHDQHVGLGANLGGGPWALFSTFNGSGLFARTLTSAGETITPIVGKSATDPHVYRIEWTADAVNYFIDGDPVATAALSPTSTINAPMGPLASDLASGGTAINIDWLATGSTPATGTFVSRVLQADDSRTVWGALSSTSSDVSFKTRTGDTSTPDATWSDWADVSSGTIASPNGRYLQYEAILTGATSSLDSVEIPYTVDATAPDVTLDGVQVSGTTATATFHSAAADLKRFECSVDSGAFVACTSPDAFTNVAPGSHTFAVRAVDQVGNASAPASQSFTIASPPPTNNGGGTSGGSTGASSGTSGQQTSNNNNSNGNGSTGNSSVDRTAPKVALRSTSLHLSKHGTVSVKLKCPAGEQRCRVTLQLMRGKSVVGHKTVTIKGGKTATISVQLTKAIRRQLSGHRKVKLTAAIKATDAAGNVKKTKRTVTVRG